MFTLKLEPCAVEVDEQNKALLCGRCGSQEKDSAPKAAGGAARHPEPSIVLFWLSIPDTLTSLRCPQKTITRRSPDRTKPTGTRLGESSIGDHKH